MLSKHCQFDDFCDKGDLCDFKKRDQLCFFFVDWDLLYGTDSNSHDQFPIAMSFPKKLMYVMHLFIPTIDRFHCHAIKKNKLKTIQCKKLRNCDVIEVNRIRHLSQY